MVLHLFSDLGGTFDSWFITVQ